MIVRSARCLLALALGLVAAAGCVVDGVDPNRTPVLPEDAACDEGEFIQRVDGRWGCATAALDVARTPTLSPETICRPGQTVVRASGAWTCADLDSVDETRTPTLPEGGACRPDDVVIRTQDGWRCGAIVVSSGVSVSFEPADGCPNGGHRLTLQVEGEAPQMIELCNGETGPRGPAGEGGEQEWRARAAIDVPSNGLNLSVSPIPRAEPVFIQDRRLSMTALPGSTASANLQIPCANGGPSGATCGGRNEQLGIVFDAPSRGTYRVCAHFTHQLSTTSVVGGRVSFLLAQTRPNSASIETRGPIEKSHGLATTGGIRLTSFAVCDQFEVTAAGTTAVRLARWQTGQFDQSELQAPVVFEVERRPRLAP